MTSHLRHNKNQLINIALKWITLIIQKSYFKDPLAQAIIIESKLVIVHTEIVKVAKKLAVEGLRKNKLPK